MALMVTIGFGPGFEATGALYLYYEEWDSSSAKEIKIGLG
jgi:hypothetical protein